MSDRNVSHVARRTRDVDVVDEQLDVAGTAEHAPDHDHRDAGRTQHDELGCTADGVGPERVLQEMDCEEVQRADRSAGESDDHRRAEERG